MKIVETLERQHGLLKGLVGEVDRALADGDMAEISSQLVRLRSALEAHLALENEEFYPSMVSMAERQQQPQLLQIVKLFDQNMRVIAEGVVKFFDRFAGKPIERAQFEQHWRSVVVVLAQRIQDEELTLHPIHDRLAKSTGQRAAQAGAS